MREWVLAIRAIQASWATGEPLAFEGRWTQHTYCPPLFVPPAGPPAPILLGALGPRMTQMAVEVADGILIHPFCSELSLVQNTWPLIPDGFPVIGQTVVGVARDEQELQVARDGIRMLLAFYGSTPSYKPVLDAHGWGDLQQVLRDLTREGRWSDLPAAVPDEVLETIAVIGTPAEVAAGLQRRFARCTRVALSVPYAVAPEALAELAALAR